MNENAERGPGTVAHIVGCRYCLGLQRWEGDAPLPFPLTIFDKGLTELHCGYDGAPSPRFRFECPICTANGAPHTGAVAPSVQAFVGGFDPCCGQPPKVTEWRPGCYGAQCMTCGVIVGDERQLDRNELMAEWNRVMRNRTANATGERSATGNDHG